MKISKQDSMRAFIIFMHFVCFQRSLFNQAKWATNPGLDDLTHICLVPLLSIKSEVSLLIRLKLSSWSWIPPLQLSQVYKRGFITFCPHALRETVLLFHTEWYISWEIWVISEKNICLALRFWFHRLPVQVHYTYYIWFLHFTPMPRRLFMNSFNIREREAGIAFNNWFNFVCVNAYGSDSESTWRVSTDWNKGTDPVCRHLRESIM